MGTRLGYVAIVSPRSSISTKVTAQESALVRMKEAGALENLVMTECSMDSSGDDWVQFGSCSQIRLRRSGRLHSFINVGIGYPRLYRTIIETAASARLDTMYLRKPPVFDLCCIEFLRSLRRRGVRVVLEIPTYPYDSELKAGSLILRMDRAARARLATAVDLIATFSGDSTIFDVPCVNLVNSAPVADLPLARRIRSETGIRMTCVSALESWHRLDRLIGGLIGSWSRGDNRVAGLNIVGEGPARDALARMVEDSDHARSRIRFWGALYGEPLSALFDKTDLAVGNLELSSDRSLSSVQPLKHREYAARGLPFIYGLPDPSFGSCSYALRLPETAVDISEVIDWYEKLEVRGEDIRLDATRRFDWALQFERVMNALGEKV